MPYVCTTDTTLSTTPLQVSKVALRNQQELEFDIPYLELGFYGTPFKEMVFVQPTTYALLNVTDQVRASVCYTVLCALR
jgi:nucleosome binding factor SPN SPT16 subunit